MGNKGLIREAQVNVFLLPFGEEEKKTPAGSSAKGSE